MKTCKNLLLALCVTAMAALGACTGSDADVLSTIPADAGMVVRINADKVLESAGCEKDGDNWKPGEVLEQLLSNLKSGDRAELDRALAALTAIDTENIFVYEYKSEAFATCVVKHPNQLAAAMEKELGKPDAEDGFKVYDNNIVLRDNRLWLARSVKKLSASLEAAAKESAAGVKAVAATMENSGDAFAVALNYGALAKANPYIAATGAMLKEYTGDFVAYHIAFDKNKMMLKGALLSPDGTALSMDGKVAPVDDSFTQYLPANTLLSFAFGKPSDDLTKAWIESLGAYAADAFGPYMSALNGTSSLSVAPPARFDDFLRLSEWTATITAQYDSDKAAEILKIAAGLKNQGLEVNLLADQININVPGGIGLLNPANFYIGYFDGTLIASTRPIVAGQQNTLPAYFDGYYSAGVVDLPADGDIARGFHLPFGLKSTMACEGEEFHSECELTGSNHRFIESIIMAATDGKFHRGAVEAFGRLQQQSAE